MHWQKINNLEFTPAKVRSITTQLRAGQSVEAPIKRAKYRIHPDGHLELLLNDEAYEIVPSDKIKDKLDKILDDPATALRGRDRLYMRIKDLKLIGISRPAVAKYLAGNETAQLHQPLRRPTVHKPIITNHVLDRMQADLIEMGEWAGHNHRRAYALTIIDCFSKYAWVKPMTKKTAEKTLEALEPILRQYTPKILQTDNGGEFINAAANELYKELGIKHLNSFPYKPSTNGMIERFNQTIKRAIMQYMTAKGTKRWYDIVDTLVDNYNDAYHSTIKAKPKDVFFSDGVGTRKVAKNIKAAAHKMVEVGSVTRGVSLKRAKVGQLVRVNILRLDNAQRAEDLKGFRKMSGINYSRNIFKVASIVPRRTKAAGADEYLLAEAYEYVPENRRTRTQAHYVDLGRNGRTALLPQQFYWDELLVISKRPENLG